MISRLIYVSRAPSPRPPDIKDILASSRRNNPSLEVTGALCFLNGVYLQYLEGERETVRELYRVIERDGRHFMPAIIDQRPIDQRVFPRWSMALLTWSEESKAIFRRFSPGSDLDLYTLDRSTAASLLQAWAGTRNWQEV